MRALLWALLAAVNAWGAIGYARFAHPRGDYVLEYPSDWKRSYGIQTLALQPPGKEGVSVRFSIQRFPVGRRDPPTPEAYAENLLKEVGVIQKLDSKTQVTVSGIPSERIAMTETVALKGSYGQKLPGPLRGVHLVVPRKGSYYVLTLEGIGAAFDRALPEFERMSGNIRFGAPGDPKKL